MKEEEVDYDYMSNTEIIAHKLKKGPIRKLRSYRARIRMMRIYINLKKKGFKSFAHFISKIFFINIESKNELEIDKVQKKAFDIVIKYLYDKNNILLMDPYYGKRYIQKFDDYYITPEKVADTYIEVEKYKLTIVNHKYYYDVTISEKTYDMIIKEFDKELLRRRRKMEFEIKSNVLDSLDNILSDNKRI